MADKHVKQDDDTRKGVVLVTLLMACSLIVGAGMSYFWQTRSQSTKPGKLVSRYLTLGETAMAIGDRSMLVQLTLEYADPKAEEPLKKALPLLKRQVTKRMSQLQPADLNKLRTRQGKEAFAEDVLTLVREALPEEDGDKVRGILYEKFLIGD